MDKKELANKIREKLFATRHYWVMALVVLGIGGIVAGLFKNEKSRKAISKPFAFVWKKTSKAGKSVQKKVYDLKYAHEENRRLQLENLNLRKWAESLRFSCSALEAETLTQDLSMRLEEKTGLRVGRVLSSIQYRPPPHLLPEQLFTLGVSYFNGMEHEKAAVIFTFLTGLENNHQFKTPRNLLLTGMLWYKMDHVELANHYFDAVLSFPKKKHYLRYMAQARLWRALSAEHGGEHGEAQQWLRNLVDYHPRSPEANWINGKGTLSAEAPGHHEHERSPASLDIDHPVNEMEHKDADHSPSEAHESKQDHAPEGKHSDGGHDDKHH